MLLKKENLNSANLVSYGIWLLGAYITLQAGVSFVEYGKNAKLLEAEKAKIEVTANQIKQEQSRAKPSAQTMSADYYINSIYAYAMLHEYKTEIVQKPSKYTGFVLLEVIFANLTSAQIVDFANTVKHLGFIEKVENAKIVIHVESIQMQKVKEIIIDQENRQTEAKRKGE